MPSFFRNDVVLLRYPFTDLSGSKIRPAIVVGAPDSFQDCFVVPLTSQTKRLRTGKFLLDEWKAAGLNVESVVKRGLATVHMSLLIKRVGRLQMGDVTKLNQSLTQWLELALEAKDDLEISESSEA